ncbi:GNAT family N-acetyltransferase [Lactiplantibacillus plantarum]|uniref:GNAT family N-acetyltransferase n=1 Tax=Lactiplantibacillus plantarum TaxID=1590 RepID=UPI0014561163|nr:GNAT family N-acetyltransferase [Lactiplantibacillus plantarum]NLS63072.1 GNAT family N-acetyltransferase [Lactiplantibacillus plantarum]
MNLKWYVKQFNGLTTTQLHDIYQLRAKTFIKEQDRSYQDPDDTDLDAHHVFAYDQGQLVAYARIYEHAGVVSFGRITTDSCYRGTGLGKQLMNHVMAILKVHYSAATIEIDAQTHAQKFYEKFGLIAEGQPYIDLGAEVIKMHAPARKLVLA